MSKIINGEKYTEFSDIFDDESRVPPALRAQIELETEKMGERVKKASSQAPMNTDTEVKK